MARPCWTTRTSPLRHTLNDIRAMSGARASIELAAISTQTRRNLPALPVRVPLFRLGLPIGIARRMRSSRRSRRHRPGDPRDLHWNAALCGFLWTATVCLGLKAWSMRGGPVHRMTSFLRDRRPARARGTVPRTQPGRAYSGAAATCCARRLWCVRRGLLRHRGRGKTLARHPVATARASARVTGHSAPALRFPIHDASAASACCIWATGRADAVDAW